ncbi:MAG: cell division protein ZapA, partial [Pseudomonadota bacterium]|nr:cell division protein ZapA [Pseudomonadota bacterium]
MSDVKIEVNGRYYQIACEDGQEDHLQRLAGFLE